MSSNEYVSGQLLSVAPLIEGKNVVAIGERQRDVIPLLCLAAESVQHNERGQAFLPHLSIVDGQTT